MQYFNHFCIKPRPARLARYAFTSGYHSHHFSLEFPRAVMIITITRIYFSLQPLTAHDIRGVLHVCSISHYVT
ncbi:hypothetical protein CWS02_16785 [Enterobacter sp. EA-1]|nr:hypothetical protein CWS02_16785 [Enterobacter sp. EA-1]